MPFIWSSTAKKLQGAERPSATEERNNIQPRSNMKYLIISAEMKEGPHDTIPQEVKSPILVPMTPLGPDWQDSPRDTGSFIAPSNLQLRGKIQLEQILHLSTVHKAHIIPLQSICIYMTITEQNYRSQCRKPLLIWNEQIWTAEKNLALSTVLEICGFHNPNEVTLNVTLKQRSSKFTGGILV